MELQLDSLQAISINQQSLATNKQIASAAIYYHPDGYETRRKQLMGRHAAGEAFLSALVRYGQQQRFYCYAQTKQQFEHFLSKVKQSTAGAKLCSWISWQEWARLSETGCLFMPSPTLKDLAWQRRHGSPRAYSLCGITHTTATKVVMDAIGDLLTAPLQQWDAVICTSASVKSMVTELLSNYGEYLHDHFGLPRAPECRVQLPIIPLGVHCSDYDKPEDIRASIRKTWREKMKIAEDDVVFLYVGRFSSHSKAHPVPMFLALEHAAKQVNVRLRLVMAGWFPSEDQQRQFVQAARQFCPSVMVHVLDGRLPEVREQIWFAADIFTSLSDNIQETFGLTPVEAMAAGLPSVISDWDGYKETVRDGIDGFRIPTWMAPPGHGVQLAGAHANQLINYDQYIGQQSLVTAIDIGDTAVAYARLASDAALREQMGESAKKQASNAFDWKIIIPQYESLWSELAILRQKAIELTPRPRSASVNPLRDDPTRLFASYPTHHLVPETFIQATPLLSETTCERLSSLPINRLAKDMFGNQTEIKKLIAMLSSGCSTAQTVIDSFAEERRQAVKIQLLWMAKLGLIRLR